MEYHRSLMECCGLFGVSNVGSITKKEVRSLERKIRKQGYTFATATTAPSPFYGGRGQEAAERAFKAAGWQPLTSFVNQRTGNTVTMWGRDLSKPVPRKKKA